MSPSYGISPRRRNVLIGVWLLLTLPLAGPGLVMDDPALLLAAGIVTVIMVPIFWLAVGAARLIVSDDGIELRQLGWRVATPWTNVAGVRLARGREGLVLREPLRSKGADRLEAAAGFTFRGASLYDDEQRALIAERRFIPIEPFAYWLEHGDLRTALMTRVPELAGPDAWTPPAAQKLPPGRIALVVSIILAALLAGVWIAVSPPEVQASADRLLSIPIALALGIYAVVNVRAATRYLRAGRWGWGLLWAAMALVQALVVLAILGWLIGD